MDIIVKTAEQAIKLLNSVRAEYKVILPTGEQFGGLEIKPKEEPKTNGKSRRRTSLLPYGTMSSYVRPYMEELQVADVATIPAGEYPLREVQHAAVSLAAQLWGKGSARTYGNHKTAQVEVLRVG